MSENRTVFFASGKEDEVVEFLESVVAALRDLPVERLDAERRVLETEAAAEGYNTVTHLQSLRFGPNGYGLSDYKELGLGWLDKRWVEAWASDFFTTANASIWATFELPESLDLGLERGEPFRPPEPDPRPGLEVPTCVTLNGAGKVALGYMVPRSPEAMAALGITGQRVHERLRMEKAITYAVAVSYAPFTADAAHAHVAADCLDENAGTVRTELLAAFDDVADNGPTQEELDRYVRGMAETYAEPESSVLSLDRMSTDRLFGRTPTPTHELIERARSLTRDGVAEAMRAILPSTIALLPAATACPPDRFAAYLSGPKPPPVTRGQRFSSGRRWWWIVPPAVRLTIGEEGLTLYPYRKEPLTVRFEDCVAVIEKPFAEYEIWSRDETYIAIRPFQLGRAKGKEILQLLRESVPPGTFVPLPR